MQKLTRRRLKFFLIPVIFDFSLPKIVRSVIIQDDVSHLHSFLTLKTWHKHAAWVNLELDLSCLRSVCGDCWGSPLREAGNSPPKSYLQDVMSEIASIQKGTEWFQANDWLRPQGISSLKDTWFRFTTVKVSFLPIRYNDCLRKEQRAREQGQIAALTIFLRSRVSYRLWIWTRNTLQPGTVRIADHYMKEARSKCNGPSSWGSTSAGRTAKQPST